MPNSYAGKILWVNLYTGESFEEPTEKYSDWIGGRSLGAFILSHQIDLLRSKPAEQPMVIATGPLTATAIPLSTRTAVTARNQVSGGFCYSNVGGDFGKRLKMSGYDAIVIQGSSSNPIYILLQDGNCSFQPADELWGMPITPMQKFLFDRYGKKHLSFIGIGPAGEHLSNISCLMVDQAHAAGWGGSGSLFGAKKLKAIVAQGNRTISAFDAEGLSSRARQLQRRIGASEAMAAIKRGGTHGTAGAGGFSKMVPTAVRNLQDEWLSPEESAPMREEVYHQWETNRTGCVTCYTRCLHLYSLESDRYGTMNVEGMHANSVRGFGSNLGINDPIDILKLHHMCNENGMDVDGASSTLAFALECAEHGILDREQPGGVRLEWGNGPSMVTLLQQIVDNINLGQILSKGAYFAAHEIARGAEKHAVTIKRVGINEQGIRSHVSWGLGIMLSSRGGGHLGGATQAENRRWSPEVGEALFGNPHAGEPGSYEGKGKMIAWQEGLKAIVDSLGLCYFSYGWYEPSIGDPDEQSDMLYLATGERIPGEELHRRGIRTHTLERYLGFILGGLNRKDDQFPDRFYDTAISSGPYQGIHLDREKVSQTLDEYYQSLGWDPVTGLPSPDLLKQLGLAYLIQEEEV